VAESTDAAALREVVWGNGGGRGCVMRLRGVNEKLGAPPNRRLGARFSDAACAVHSKASGFDRV
jgi:hypothetical protein